MFKRFMQLSTAAGVFALSLATVGFLVTASYGAIGDVHNAAAEWDTDNNPNGNWEYQHNDLLGNFHSSGLNGTLLPSHIIFGRPMWALTDNANCCVIETINGFNTQPTRSNLRLAVNGPLAIEWTAPAGVGPAVEVYTSTEVIFEAARQQRVITQLNGTDVGTVLSPPGVTQTLATLTQVVSVVPGDTLTFIMDPYGPDGDGHTTLHPTEIEITEIPEPASLMLLGVGGALALATSRRRRRL